MRTLFFIVALLLYSVAHATSFYSIGQTEETLGRGFDSTIYMPLEHCLNGNWNFQGNSQGYLNFTGDYDDKTLISDISGSIKGSTNLVIFGGSAKFSMVKKITKNNNSAGSVIQFRYKKGNYSLENRSLTPDISSLLDTNPSKAVEKCGDSFINNIVIGSNLYLSAKLHFRTREEYNWYQQKIKVRFAFWSKTKTKTKESTKATADAVYSISFQADGGITPKLAEFINNGPMYCKTDAMDPCYEYVDQLLAYIVDGGSYTQELQDSQLNVISYDIESYERSGHFNLAYAGYPEDRSQYIALSERLRSYQDLVNDYLENLYAFLAVESDESQKSILEEKITHRTNQKKALDNAASHCYELPGVYSCQIKIEAAIASVD